MEAPLTDRRSVEAAVASLQERLADGDSSDAGLQSYGQSMLATLRAAYRAAPASFTPETIEALRELKDILSQTE